MLLLGLFIPFGVGVLAAMELRTPPRNAETVVEPIITARAETRESASDSQGALAKADRLDIVAANNETPAAPAIVSERPSRPEAAAVRPSEAPRAVKRHRHDPKPKKVTTAAAPKSKPKKADVKRTTTSERRKTTDNTEPCRLSAFGGLLKALGSADCEI